MTPTQIRIEVVTERVAWIRKMVDGILGLPLSNYTDFVQDARNPAAAESYLRRALEALLDLGRHILAKGFAVAATEYKDIGPLLAEHEVLTKDDAERLRRMGSYRNRLVHFYHEIDHVELYEICTKHLDDIQMVLDAFLTWMRSHPEKVDKNI